MSNLLNYFDLRIAKTAMDIDLLQHLRWAVYCKEFHYEREEDCPGERESDPFDAKSIHLFIMHKSSGHIAGCVRIICAGTLGLGSLLPLEAAYQRYKTAPDFSQVSRDKMIEISRLAVAAEFRRRTGEQGSPIGLMGVNELESASRSFPMLPLSLYLAIAAYGELCGLHDTYGYAMMEPRLVRLLKRFGIHFNQIAPAIDYHGIRAAYCITLDEVFSGLKDDMRELYSDLRHSLENELREMPSESNSECKR